MAWRSTDAAGRKVPSGPLVLIPSAVSRSTSGQNGLVARASVNVPHIGALVAAIGPRIAS